MTHTTDEREFGIVNIEGAALQNDRLLLLQRGSRAGVALGFTDAMCLPDGQLLALAVTEDTDDPYADGKAYGSYLCRFDAHNRLQAVIPLLAPAKTEGIALWGQAAPRMPSPLSGGVGSLRKAAAPTKNSTLAFVTDADDAHIPASLLTAPLSAFLPT